MADARSAIVEAMMKLAAERRFEDISIRDIAAEAGVSLADFRDAFPSKGAALGGFSRKIDRAVLSVPLGELASSSARDRLFDVLINGDGSQDGAATTVQSGTSGDMDTTDVINWATCLPTPYKMNAHAGRKAQLKLWYAVLAGFQNPMTTWGFVGITLPTTHEWDRSVIDSDYLIGVDSRYAVEHLTMGPVLTEVEKLVRRQVQGTAISHRDAFAIFDRNAIAIFDGTHA